MKMKQEHYQHLLEQLHKVDKGIVERHRETLKADPQVKDLEKRVRWDVLHALRFHLHPYGRWLAEMYKYLDDSHIDTALRRAMYEAGL